MSDIIEFIQSNISAFDLIVFLIFVYSMAQCAAKGFMRSLLSFSKWILALVITIYFGVFTGIAMLLAMISVLTLLPKLILIVKPFGNA